MKNGWRRGDDPARGEPLVFTAWERQAERRAGCVSRAAHLRQLASLASSEALLADLEVGGDGCGGPCPS